MALGRPPTTPADKRIRELDGLRAVAVLTVVLYHFFQRFPNDFPYGDRIFPWVGFGYLGVHLFFMISGFAIAFTLNHASGPLVFIRHRFFRLWPPMLVCSLLTFVVMNVVDTPFTEARRVGVEAFLPSLTFIAPFIWDKIIPVSNWIDGAYWSLFVEVRFYFWALVIATIFGNRNLAAALTGSAVALAIIWHLAPNAAVIFYLDTLFFVPYLPLFAAGVLTYQALTGLKTLRFYTGFTLIWIAEITMLANVTEYTLVSMFFLLFLILIERRAWLAVLTARPLVAIGLISYSLYLLHQNIGGAVLSSLPAGWPMWSYALVALCVLGVIMLLARGVYQFVERPSQSLARRFDQRFPT
ncbi:acyltransferase [Cereibacter sphaeroides]|uniref:acyltransferase family protein n=1 Tax=Cereibacter sphaeroides TaxID=1063 RepID=UPI002279B14A|nr:acyltransferase [Cereibacter sphaeroides]MCE6949616.1 acyltransferase [Cereibacter sphaeroides]